MNVKAVPYNIKGKVYITNLSNLSKVPKENNYLFLITRGKRLINGVRYLPELAPSPFLYNKYMNNWKGKDDKTWWPIYKKIFLKELNFNYVKKIEQGLSEGKNCTLICFCGDESICHRSILKEIFHKKGYETISIKKGD